MPGLRGTVSLEDLNFPVLSKSTFKLFLWVSSDVQPNCHMKTNGRVYFQVQRMFQFYRRNNTKPCREAKVAVQAV